jgi:hypothetical protein
MVSVARVRLCVRPCGSVRAVGLCALHLHARVSTLRVCTPFSGTHGEVRRHPAGHRSPAQEGADEREHDESPRLHRWRDVAVPHCERVVAPPSVTLTRPRSVSRDIVQTRQLPHRVPRCKAPALPLLPRVRS